MMNLIFREYEQTASAAVAPIGLAAADVSIQYAQFLFFRCFR